MTTKNADVLPLFGSLNESWEDVEKLWTSHPDREMFRVTRRSIVVVRIEAAEFYINNLKKSKTFHTPSFHRFGEQLPEKLYHL